tara:strand:- start:4040 stop:4339 length:300 start_codon:yes stop_codon:yes gene_type:complete
MGKPKVTIFPEGKKKLKEIKEADRLREFYGKRTVLPLDVKYILTMYSNDYGERTDYLKSYEEGLDRIMSICKSYRKGSFITISLTPLPKSNYEYIKKYV